MVIRRRIRLLIHMQVGEGECIHFLENPEISNFKGYYKKVVSICSSDE